MSGRQLSVLLQLNDDYSGGELVFPRQDVTLAPKAGNVIVFPSGFCFPHVANKVTRGTKYVVVSWLSCTVPQAAQNAP